jgi:hypothetical protein
MTGTLIKRRDKVLRTWLNAVNPVIDPVIDAEGRLTWGNAAIAAGVASDPEGYRVQWFAFDNATHTARDEGAPQQVTVAASAVPVPLRQGHEYIGVRLTSQHPEHAAWAKPATFYFRRAAAGWTWVGAERE